MKLISFIQKKNLERKAIVLLMLITIATGSLSPLFVPQTAEAQLSSVASAISVPVDDLINNLKETTLDQIAWSLAKLAVQQMTTSIVNWINSGFDGNPAFVTDPLGFLQDVADQTLGEFIEGSEFGLLCSPFKVQISMALITNQRHFKNQASCRLSDVLDNVQNYKDFVSFNFDYRNNSSYMGTWDDWYDVAVRPGGNLYSAYNIARAEAAIRISSQQGSFTKQLDWGSGFLSWRDCSKAAPGRIAGDLDLTQACPIVTPGSVIADQLNHSLGLGQDELVTADEFNEIISALFSQLLNQIFGPDGGLFGTSESNSSFDGDSYLNSLYQDSVNSYGQTQTSSKANINNAINTMEDYIAVKNQSIAKIQAAITLQGNISLACGPQSAQAATASSTVATSLNPMKITLQGNIASANQYIAQFENFKTRIDKLDSSDTTGFTQILSEYSNLILLIRPDSAVTAAEYERDVTVPDTLSSINAVAQSTINTCLIQSQTPTP